MTPIVSLLYAPNDIKPDRQQLYEDLVGVLLSRLHNARRVDGSGGDGGKDVYLPGEDGDIVYQLKCFTRRLEGPQRKQIRRSLDRVAPHKPTEWYLVIPLDLTLREEEWLQDVGAHTRGGFPKRPKL